jgi:hypothetical protein
MANRDVILSLSKDPLTSILSHGGERKIKVKGLQRRLIRHPELVEWVPRNDRIDSFS